ncbi:MAG: acetyl-CoA C-acyltransferase FadI [Acidobacteria bacterium]|nr:acetyl-CoA C-acyltransferase FadI [Acidobacteriota bacterium]
MAEQNRVAIVKGLRTPFAKAGTVYSSLDALELGKIIVSELVQNTGIDPETVNYLVFGTVIPNVKAANVAREIVLGTSLPRNIPAHTVSQACASANQSITTAADMIHRGYADIVIAGGAESLSNVPILFSKKFSETLVAASRQKSMPGKLKAFSRLRPQHLAPDIPAIAESTTGLTMGQSAEIMAKENSISREAQDRFAYQSHHRASEAFEKGYFDDEVMTVLVPDKYETIVKEDNLIRKDTTIEKLSTLNPVFDKKYGSITAGNSSPLTDGAAAMLLMSEKKAKALGFEPLAYLKSYAYAALDPFDQLLQGPAFAIPQALDRAGLTLGDIDVIEMHEAFAAQVLSNIQWLGSKEFAQKRLGRDQAVGEIDPEAINLTGGSIAIGHPFGATGSRVVTSVANQMKRSGKQYGLVTVCAAGGLGSAIILERE